jgi:hypothetical protein
MKRFASHYLFFPPNEVFKLHYIELDENNCFQGIFPLEKEIAQTSFHNGILLPFKQEISPKHLLLILKGKEQTNPEKSIFQLLEDQYFPEIGKNDAVFLYILNGIDLLTAKFCTSNSRSNSYIQRIC